MTEKVTNNSVMPGTRDSVWSAAALAPLCASASLRETFVFLAGGRVPFVVKNPRQFVKFVSKNPRHLQVFTAFYRPPRGVFFWRMENHGCLSSPNFPFKGIQAYSSSVKAIQGFFEKKKTGLSPRHTVLTNRVFLGRILTYGLGEIFSDCWRF
jgi:hypothetical protein